MVEGARGGFCLQVLQISLTDDIDEDEHLRRRTKEKAKKEASGETHLPLTQKSIEKTYKQT